MSLPDDFSPWEHLRQVTTVAHNLNVERTFFGVDATDITNFQGSLKQACLIQDDDTSDMIILRKFTYYFDLKNIPIPNVYGTPIPDYQAQVTFSPQIKLYFIEPYTQELAAEKLNQATAQLGFRLIHETSQTINRDKALVLAERIKSLFSQGMGFTFVKGKNKYTYVDKINAYRFTVYAESEGEAVKLMSRACEINEHSFNEELLKTHIDKTPYPNNPGYQEVYGVEVKKPRRRPTTQVRFQRAELFVHGLKHPVSLVDFSRKTAPLVS